MSHEDALPPRKRPRTSSSSSSLGASSNQDDRKESQNILRAPQSKISADRSRALTPSQGSQEMQSSESENVSIAFPIAGGASVISGFSKASAIQQHRPNQVVHPSQYDPENPFITGTPSLSTGFLTARALARTQEVTIGTGIRSSGQSTARFGTGSRSPSPPEAAGPQTYSDWFSNKKIPGTPGSASGSSMINSPQLGFESAAGNSVVVSAAAMQAAEDKMKAWEEEEDSDLNPSSRTSSSTAKFTATLLEASPAFDVPRKSLVHNSPSPTKDAERSTNDSQDPTSRFTAPLSAVTTDLKGRTVAKPFQSPALATKAAGSLYVNSPLNPSGGAAASFTTPAKPFRPPYPSSTPSTIPSTAFRTPTRTSAFPPPLSGTAGRHISSHRAFRTPFKKGLAPGESGHSQLLANAKSSPRAAGGASLVSPPKKHRPVFFNLKPPKERKTLETNGVVPGSYTLDEMESMGICTRELLQINVNSAGYYGFNSPLQDPSSPSQPAPTQVMLMHSHAFEYLKEIGCALVTEEWVENHWRLILWKLAGMVFLIPDREMYDDKRWSWDEVLRQLRYRYERELNGGSRPLLACIATQDLSPAMPMVLCVSNVLRDNSETNKDGVNLELELTDGWYRIRAKVDAPLARAAQKGMIKIGRKIGIIGAYLTPKRSEPCEILAAYDKVKLSIVGNSTHLAPWHCKLGLMKQSPVSTLSSLTPDGGNVQLMHLMVVKVHPLGFYEFSFINGKKAADGPYDQAIERQRQRAWEAKREKAEEKIRLDVQRRHSSWKRWEEKLKRKARGQFPREDGWYPSILDHGVVFTDTSDIQPDHIDDITDELIDSGDIDGLMNRISTLDAGWVADNLAIRIIDEQQSSSDVMGPEIDVECPRRDVTSFRILWMKDVHTNRKSANRTAEVTVWNVTNIVVDEDGSPVNFKEGQRFRISSLQPQKQNAWMHSHEKDAFVYLYTLKSTRWTKI